jgi:hypothetical protein
MMHRMRRRLNGRIAVKAVEEKEKERSNQV